MTPKERDGEDPGSDVSEARDGEDRDALPSWNDGPAKSAILDYVERVTRAGSSEFVDESDRIAVFDNDGTLWPENPVPFQLAFILDLLRERGRDHPEWQNDRMVRAALDGNVLRLVAHDYRGLAHIVALTHAGMTPEAFAVRVNAWMSSARHPRFGRPYDACTYQPMRELLDHLRGRGFKLFIVSGGGADFMRVWTERVYGVPPERVVGSHGGATYELRDGVPILTRTMDEIFVNDGVGKPVGIHQFIGRRPIAAFGNSDGDKAMLEYTTLANPHPTLGVILHHTDGEREYAYDARPTSTGMLVEALADAPKRGWHVVDMATDWNRVFPGDPEDSGSA